MPRLFSCVAAFAAYEFTSANDGRLAGSCRRFPISTRLLLRTQIDEVFIHTHFEDSTHGIEAAAFAQGTTGTNARRANLPFGSGDDLVGDTSTVRTTEILIRLVGRTGEPPLNQHRVTASTVGTDPLFGRAHLVLVLLERVPNPKVSRRVRSATKLYLSIENRIP